MARTHQIPSVPATKHLYDPSLPSSFSEDLCDDHAAEVLREESDRHEVTPAAPGKACGRCDDVRINLSTILRAFPKATADTIATVASECAHELRSQGWEGDGTSYDLGAFPGDEELLGDVLSRPTTLEERVAFERCVRACLGASS